MKWIRFESNKRYHAVYGVIHGTRYVTYCGRFADLQRETTTDPPARCGCCKSRIKSPYLIPEKLQAITNTGTTA